MVSFTPGSGLDTVETRKNIWLVGNRTPVVHHAARYFVQTEQVTLPVSPVTRFCHQKATQQMNKNCSEMEKPAGLWTND
jgi:hypothetical protein